jgi:hypothetical protein
MGSLLLAYTGSSIWEFVESQDTTDGEGLDDDEADEKAKAEMTPAANKMVVVLSLDVEHEYTAGIHFSAPPWREEELNFRITPPRREDIVDRRLRNKVMRESVG